VKQSLLREKYPIYCLELERVDTRCRNVDEIMDYLKGCVAAHASACFIADFDHYAHTRSLPHGQIGEGILAARNLIFCFGITLPDPHVLAVRPCSIGVAETTEGFLITFMEAPMPVANTAMEEWAKGLRDLPKPIQSSTEGEPACASA